jgi:hypothetical protein
MENPEHVVELNARQLAALRTWLVRPNGGWCAGRITVESVEHGGILIRTRPWAPAEEDWYS